MEEAFVCSLIHNGILGGGLYITEEDVTYRTNKLTVERKYRYLTLKKDDMERVSWKGWLGLLVTFFMKDGGQYQFLIFNRKRFLRVLEQFRR